MKIYLDKNEMPLSPPKGIIDKVKKSIEHINRYTPQSEVRKLLNLLSIYSNAPENSIFLSSGSDILIKELKDGTYVIKNVDDTGVDVTLEKVYRETKISPKINGENISIDIDIYLEVSIAEITGTVDFINGENRKKLEEQAEKEMKKQFKEVIKKAQKDYKTDIFGFGRLIKADYPKVWREVSSNWESTFINLPVDVNVNVNVVSSALLSKPAKKGD